MPIVPASKAESDELEYSSFRPSQKDRDTEIIKKQLQKIESDRLRALERNRVSSQRIPPHEEGFTHPTFDEDHGCWKIQSLKGPKTLKIWDEKRETWRVRFDTSRHNDASGVALLGEEDRAESWLQAMSRRASVWFGIKKGR